MQRDNKYFVGSVILLMTLFLTILAAELHGQEYRTPVQGYIFAGPGAAVYGGDSGSIYHFGAGADWFIRKGFSAGGELGYLAPESRFADGFGVLSVNPAYHFVPKRTPKVVPFVTGGYSLGFRSGHINMANFGGGVSWWIGQRHGIRFEFRDHYSPAADTHFPTFRVAWTFR